MNIGCDREFFISVMPIIKAAYISPRQRPLTDVVFELGINAWPTSSDLSSHTVIPSDAYPLCRARLNLQSGVVTDLEFVQSGVDEAIRQKGFPPVISATHAETAIRFPCRSDAAFMNALSAHRPNLTGEPDFIEALEAQGKDTFGRFGIDCALDSWQITQKWPQLFDTTKIVPDADMCQSGLALLQELRKSNPLDKRLNDGLSAAVETVSASATKGDIADCVGQAVAGWQEYWQIVTVPTAPAGTVAQD
jgi:hypothetical protein